MNDEIRKMIIIAYSSGYEHGHNDTVEGVFSGNGRSESHDVLAADWADQGVWDGVFDRDLDL